MSESLRDRPDDHLVDVDIVRLPDETTRQRLTLALRQADPSDTGYGHSPAQVRAVAPENAGVLVGYYTAVHERTVAYLRGLSDADLDRVVDEAWDPPVTLGVRLVSVYDDDTQHEASRPVR